MSPLEQPISFKNLALGRHLTIEYYDCSAQILADVKTMEQLFVDAAKRSGATVLESSFHAFQPQGVSGIVVICESHFAVHAWPEYDYAAVDIFTCGDQIDFELAAQTLRSSLQSRSMVISHALSRGVLGQNGAVLREQSQESAPPLENTMSWRKRYESADAWGMLASVDVYDCPEEMFTSGNVCTVLKALARQLDATPCGQNCCASFHDPERGDGLRFTQILDSGTITGRFSLERKTFYCDIFMCRFFDPQELSETLINALNGSYYRLQVAMRQ
ncbi:MAG: adenosylmethionine decarboxylase [Lentisphaerae bacterium]|nr:adenosylmethionine decarboxylase [Lentisphaerota bacterium]